MTHDWLGKPRIESVTRRLKELNPRLDIVAVGENISAANAEQLVGQADVVFDCAPLFSERFAMNAACVKLGKPMVEAAMYGLECQVTTFIAGTTGCLACIYPEEPPTWKREFPVLGAVSALAGQIAAIEGIKLICGMGAGLAGTLLYCDTKAMAFQRIPLPRRNDCAVCGAAAR
jgi:molybdopterin/thiamine biosynthesis adenylyltransferase